MRPQRLIAVVAACALAGSLAHAQGLGEAAAREKQRREQQQKKRGAAKVITTEELSPGSSSEGSPGGLAQDAQRPQTSSNEVEKVYKENTDEAVEAPGEAQWRERAKGAKQELKESEARLAALQEKAGQLFGQIQASTDTNELLRLRAEQQAVTKQVEEAKIMLESSRKELRDLEEQARKAGVPPGWVR